MYYYGCAEGRRDKAKIFTMMLRCATSVPLFCSMSSEM